MSGDELVDRRLEVRSQILDCQECDLCSVGTGPVPFSGPSEADYTIIGEAPGREEDLKGRPFLGAAGQLLRRALGDAGLDPDRAFIMNSASCFPDGTPTASQVRACRPNFEAQLKLSGSGPILLLGSTALATFRPELKITRVHGHIFTAGGRTAVTSFHPAFALYKRDREPLIVADIERFAKVVAAGDKWSHLCLDTCAGCAKAEDEMTAVRFDDSGLPFCEKCWPRSAQAKAEADAPPTDTDVTEWAVQKIKETFPGTVVLVDPDNQDDNANLCDVCGKTAIREVKGVWRHESCTP